MEARGRAALVRTYDGHTDELKQKQEQREQCAHASLERKG
jgi:hypothetical protein